MNVKIPKGGMIMKMDQWNNSEYNDLKQVELSIQAAEKMVGQATRSMDEEQRQAATDALQEPKNKLHQAISFRTGVDDMFLEASAELIQKSEHQLEEAKNDN